MKGIADNILLWGLVIGLISAPIATWLTYRDTLKTNTRIVKNVNNAIEEFNKGAESNNETHKRYADGMSDLAKTLHSLREPFPAERVKVGIKGNGKIQARFFMKVEGTDFDTFKEIELSPEKAKELAFGLDAMVKFIEAKEKAE